MGQPGVGLVEGGDYGGQSQDGPGPRCGCHGKVTLLPSFPIARWEITSFHMFGRKNILLRRMRHQECLAI